MARHYNHHYHYHHYRVRYRNRNFNHYHNSHPILSALGMLFLGLIATVIGYVLYLRYTGFV
jgi:hypothetical protein